MNSYGLIGYPLEHSFSKQYFTQKFEKEKITGSVYGNFPLSSINKFPGLIKSNPSLKGLNVTIPYKEQVLNYVDELSKEVEETGAANCIKIREGNLTAYNTDITGFTASFKKKLRPEQKKALVLGSGGSSKAIQYSLKKLQIDHLIVSRSAGKAKYIQYEDLTEELIKTFTVIINCTPLGMSPNTETYPDIPYKFLGTEHYLFDLIYNPAKTLFLKKGGEKGAAIENGYEMLVLQAEESWRIWNDDQL
jgi:shikimate dehydrogenase